MQIRSAKILVFIVVGTLSIFDWGGMLPSLLAQERTAEETFEALTETQRREFISLIELGLSAYDRGDFERALRHFTDAFDIFEHPDVLYRIALTQERLGNDAEALGHYRVFLERVPDAEERGRIENTMRVIEERLAALASKIRIVTEPAGAEVYFGDTTSGPVGTTPLELPVDADTYTIVIRHGGYEPIEESIEVPRGQTVVLRYGLKPVAASKEAGPSMWPAAGAATFTVGAGILSAVFFLQAQEADREMEWLKANYSREEKEFEVARFEEDARRGRMLGGLSAGAAVVGLGATVYFITRAVSGGSAAVEADQGWTVGMGAGDFQLRWSTNF